MAAVAGRGTTFNLPNYVGELFKVTPEGTPLLSMIGGLTGGVQTTSKQFTWEDIDNASATQPEILEGADPTYESRSRSEYMNTTQIFQYGVDLTYTKQAAVGNLDGESIIGTQPVQNEAALQLSLKIARAARDVDYTFLHGAYAYPADNLTARKTRGVVTATVTNEVAAAAADLSKDMIDTTMRKLVDGGAPLMNLVAFTGSWNKQRFSNIYGIAPESRNVGGLNITQVVTDFDTVGLVYERQLTASTVAFVDLAFLKPRFLRIPGKGHFFVEEKPADGAYQRWMLYGEIGLEYGPEHWHAKITGTSTS